MTGMSRPVTFYLTRPELVVVLVVECLLILAGIGVALWASFDESWADIRFRAVLASIALGLAGSGCYYLRRIYRAAFDDRLVLASRRESATERLGALVYLLGRPLIALALTTAVAIGLVLTYTSVTPDGTAPTQDLVYLCASIGFVTGFLGGRLIEQVETTGKL